MNRTDDCDQEQNPSSSCWICLDDSTDRGQLVMPCRCSRQSGRRAHTRCLARWGGLRRRQRMGFLDASGNLFFSPHACRWQLTQAGTRRESYCDFCGEALPDWKKADGMAPCGFQAPAIMNVNFAGSTYSFQVRPGVEGYEEFTQAICRAFVLPTDAELNITFTCDEPSSGALLTLQGAGAYDAAVHCAAVSAARRMPRDGSLSPPSQPGSPSSEAPSEGPGQGEQAEHKGGKGLSGLGRRIRTAFSDLFHAAG